VIHVLLSLPSPALRAGLKSLLSTDKVIKVLDDSLEEDLEADVVITSASVVSLDEHVSAGILFLSDGLFDHEETKRMYQVWGVLPADASAEELIAAVHALAQGLVVGTSALLFDSDEHEENRGPLTERETEVLSLLAKGMPNKQIALSLRISEHTVKFHVSSIYAKLNVTNRTEAVREGLRGGWIAL